MIWTCDIQRWYFEYQTRKHNKFQRHFYCKWSDIKTDIPYSLQYLQYLFCRKVDELVRLPPLIAIHWNESKHNLLGCSNAMTCFICEAVICGECRVPIPYIKFRIEIWHCFNMIWTCDIQSWYFEYQTGKHNKFQWHFYSKWSDIKTDISYLLQYLLVYLQYLFCSKVDRIG